MPARAQVPDAPPSLRVGVLPPDLRFDGVLNEPAWADAPVIDNLTMTEPREGASPTGRTRVQVLASPRALVFGIVCDDPDPRGIVSYTKQRDGSMSAEDHIEIVLDTFLDGRSGYTFWVNPSGARYDALINPGGGDVNSDWDGIWEAATRRNETGWTAEIRIPIQTLGFKPGLTAWHFNVQRRIQRLQETDRWASPVRDYKITQMSRAGVLTNLPDFDLGVGLTVRPSVVAGGAKPAPDSALSGDGHASLDVTKRVGANLLASASVNTDFAETEVDTRQTNLTRFSLYFPEKRTFFLEGSDIFQFGAGLGSDVVPFFSRSFGLVSGRQVPIRVAGKLNGRVGQTNLGAVVAHTGSVGGVAPASTMGAFRVKQNVFKESSIGAIATFGDPTGKSGSPRGADEDQYLARPAGEQLRAVRHPEPRHRHEHAPALDVSPAGRPVRHLQPQSERHHRSLAARLESVARQGPILLEVLTHVPPAAGAQDVVVRAPARRSVAYRASPVNYAHKTEVSMAQREIKIMTDDELFADWKETAERLWDEMRQLGQNRRIFDMMRDVAEQNPRLLETGGHVLDWMFRNYAIAVAMTLRRLVDQWSPGQSLKQLLHEIEQRPTVINRDRYRHEWLAGAGAVDRMCDDAFDTFPLRRSATSPADDCIDPVAVQKDRETLEQQTHLLRDFIEQTIAHLSRGGPAVPTYGDLHRALDTLEAVFKKYYALLTQKSVVDIRPVPQYDTHECLTFPWWQPRQHE